MIAPGFCVLEVAGLPLGNVHAYDVIVLPQSKIVADGEAVLPEQISGIVLRVNCGFVLALIIVGEDITGPHFVVMVSVME